MSYKPVNKLINQYSIAYEFCGNNTKAKLILTNEFNLKLNELPYVKYTNLKYGCFLNTAVVNAMQRVQDSIVKSQPIPSINK
jgi:hypothetical protein